MAQEAAVPLSQIKELIRQEVEAGIARYARSGPLRNASITGGAGLSIQDGGSLNVDGGDVNVDGGGDVNVGPGGKVLAKHPNGKWLMLVGGYDGPSTSYNMPDGSPQPMALIYREDGSLALGMYDPDPSNGLQQFLALFDRGGNVIMSDDAGSGQGLARPYIPGVLYPNRYADLTQPTTAATDVWETVLRAELPHQQPRLELAVRATMDTTGATGELQVLVNGLQFGSVQGLQFSVASYTFGPAPVVAAHMSTLVVEVRARRRTGSGGVRAGGIFIQGRQS